MANSLTLEWQDYNLLPYEEELAGRELVALLEPLHIHSTTNKRLISVDTAAPVASAELLTYFKFINTGENQRATLQSLLEDSAREGKGRQRRQGTRYSVHGLHDYKGKFNPQVARSLLNSFRLAEGSTVLDPFCGSGTTLVEASTLGIKSLGVDVNPLAAAIANAKLDALRTPASDLEVAVSKVLKIARKKSPKLAETKRIEYLAKWFPYDTLIEAEALRLAIDKLQDAKIRKVLLVLMSDLLREYSLQEPADLRIRRRRTPLPKNRITEVFGERAAKFCSRLCAAQRIITKPASARALHGNVTIHSLPGASVFDAMLSSPPYASALPYIDTQRLSLIWMGLASPASISSLQAELIGSREFVGPQIKEWRTQLKGNLSDLPPKLWNYCSHLEENIGHQDGFRRRAVPVQLYRYLAGMKMALHNVATRLRSKARCAFIIGHNHTTLGGVRFDINTPTLISDLLPVCGYSLDGRVNLQPYQRFGIHHRNSVSQEELLMFSKI